jgi:Fur family transcriptional regulator, ferric uptake regulator
MKERRGEEYLKAAGLDSTPNRLRVLDALAGSQSALSAQDILKQVQAVQSMNKVTLYRILDLLVERGVAWRHSAGDRTFRYCLSPGEEHRVHCHFFCRVCGGMQCLPLDRVPEDVLALEHSLPVRVEDVEIRLDGLCRECRE